MYAFGHFLYDLLKKKKNISPDEDIYLNFKFFDMEERKVYGFNDDSSKLKKLTLDILKKIAPLLKENKEGSGYELWMYAQKQLAKKKWKSIYRYMKKIDLTFFSADTLRNEPIFNKKLCEILREKFLNVKMNELISGRIHVDVSETKIAIEVKKLESNTPKDELVGQIKEDLRIGTYIYGIIFGIDYTSKKELTKYNELMFDDGKIYCIIKPYPY